VKGKPEYEIVRDPAVIESYRRRREEMRIENILANPAKANLEMTGAPEEDAIRRKGWVSCLLGDHH